MDFIGRVSRYTGLFLVAAGLLAATSLAARADVMRIVVIVAADQADYDADLKEQHNAIDLMKKGDLKTGYVVADPAKLTVGTVSIWESEDKFDAVADTDPCKALIGWLKYSTRNVYRLNLQ
jgi:hypothetical protein